MKTNLLRAARRHFNSPLVDRRINRHNMRAWVASVRFLGPNWRALPSVQRVESPSPFNT